ncbi:MAG: hypothetical protein IT384_27040 [Deltaproteobacteria bacterium]|nr:hypothetical protein [Deltaproteobacteria bacterium]
MIGGGGALAITAILIAAETDGRPSVRDAVAGGLALSMLAARYLDISRFAGSTADGERATMSHYRKYAIKVVVVSLLALGGAHAAALFF